MSDFSSFGFIPVLSIVQFDFFFLLNKTCDVVRHLSRQGLSPVLRPFVLQDDLLR
jgi:hypothetical protein